MKKLKLLLCLLCAGLLVACASKRADLPHDAGDLSAKLKQGYEQKVDTALFVLDASETMLDAYQDTQKLSIAQNLLLRMNSAISGLKLENGLNVFGPNRGGHKVVYGMQALDPVKFAAAVKAVQGEGLTPIAAPISESIATLKNSKGRIAVILLSDGMNTEKDDPVQAAASLKKAYGDRICIYTILIGNSEEGKKLMQDIAKAGNCGFGTSAETLAPGNELAGYLEKVFLEKAKPAPAPAPAQPVVKPAPAPVPAAPERIVLRGINFDFDKAVIKPEFAPVLDTAAEVLKSRAGLKVNVEGHTCSMGSDAYNQKLSERRAKAVKAYLVKKGVKADNLTSVGYGESRPMSDNKKKSGRQLNRRVEFNLMQ